MKLKLTSLIIGSIHTVAPHVFIRDKSIHFKARGQGASCDVTYFGKPSAVYILLLYGLCECSRVQNNRVNISVVRP